MGKKKIIAETGAGQHGVATATAAALFDMECTIYMGEEDVKRQALNVFRMELLGAKVQSVTDGSRVLKDAVNAALRAWVANVEDTHYIMGSALGPHPFPEIVRNFQSVIGREAKRQFAEQNDGASTRCSPSLCRRRIERHWALFILLLRIPLLPCMGRKLLALE